MKVQILKTDLKPLTDQITRLADAVEHIANHLADYRSPTMLKEAEKFSPQGTAVTYTDEEVQAVRTELERLGVQFKDVNPDYDNDETFPEE